MIETLTLVAWIIFGDVPQFAVVVLVLSFVVSAVGFTRPPWFFGVASGMATAAMCIATILAYRHGLGLLAGAQLGLLFLHGARLSVFLVARERNPSFRRQLLARDTAQPMRLGRRAVVWIAVSILYFCLFSPALYSANGLRILIEPVTIAFQILGITAMLAGFSLEVVADSQKSLFKAFQPDACCYSGLYGWVRQPNHLGELLFWVGNFTAAVGFYLSIMHWVTAVAGLAGVAALIAIIARRLEEKRASEYAELPEYREYVSRVPVLIPWISPARFTPRPMRMSRNR